jgi:hypothetical protein
MEEAMRANAKLSAVSGSARRWAVLLMALLLSPCARAGMAATDTAVLLSSTAPGYVPGMVITANDRLELPDGASAMLLFRSGQMLRIRGPFTGTLSVAEGRSGDVTPGLLAKVLQMQGVDAAVIGATRAVSTVRPRLAPDDVQVDPQRSATYCLKPSDSVWISRPSEEGSSYALRRRGNTRALQWPGGASRIPWPDDVPIEDGARFEFVAEGTARATATFRIMQDRPPSGAAWLAEGLLEGCSDQFDAMLKQFAEAVVPPELWLTTDHGRLPTYHPNEPVRVTVQSSTDGYLYCVLVRGGEEAVPLSPDGALDGPRIHAAVPLSIPGSRSVSELRAGQRGTEQIRCWMADRDVSAELPHGLFSPSADRLPDRIAADLDRVFANVGRSRISKASLTIRVE